MERLIAFLVVVGVATWVAADASSLGARRGRLGGGFLDMGPIGWFFACVITWLIGLVCYLIARPRLVAAGRVTYRPYSPPPPPNVYGAWQPPPAPYPLPNYYPMPPPQGPPNQSGWSAYPQPVQPAPAPAYGNPAAAPPEHLRAMLAAGEITEWEFHALNRWQR